MAQISAELVFLPAKAKPKKSGGKSKGSSYPARLIFSSEKGEDEAGKHLKVTQSSGEFSIGLGNDKEFDLETARRAGAIAFSQAVKARGMHSIEVSPKSSKKFLSSKPAVAAFVEGVVLASYSFDKYKTAESEKPPRLSEITLPVSQSKEIMEAKAVSEAANWAREIQNEPANVATPTMLALLAAKEAKVFGLSCKIYGKGELEKLGMNSILAVSKGSAEEPKLIVLEYLPKSGVSKSKVAIVGKGVCFDSGGISIKPSRGMDEMKFDKSGAVAALGLARLAAIQKLPVHLVCVLAAVENMPSGTASKPGDIVRAHNGKTIEILDTDAEGRLILADALSFTCKEHKPDVIIDLATLTGACVVALGDVAAGLFSNDKELSSDLFKAGLESGERLWELPLMWKDYDEKVKSEVADVKNLGESGQAGATAGASFLKEFVSGAKWAHLDIAGTAWTTKPRHYYSRGGTGFGIRLLNSYLKSL